ncbi:hypothetical protein JO84_gp029 [Aureococcus anophagefferens virus]|uniref:Uncharacterized protein n=1 Tax=Aureococcus anophagefferens virus TaxID=1474867 RepID=A0A076FHP2_9VIRU|nr:hypothetical protein JO84_gp029 [Aureococcus anophagefferens virus]AII16931.1 hypothetical protein AaV_029 [Aureococcus anophagefferens virus]UOG94331.1 hypothetical protein MKD35_296 [Aureococcus anophagefferens virus]
MGCASSRSKVIEKVIETETTLVQKETTLASVLEAIPFLMNKIPKDLVHISVLSYLTYEPEALSDQNIHCNIWKYFSNYDEMFDVFVRHGSIENWNTSEVTDMSYLFQRVVGVCEFDLDLSNWDISRVKSIKNMFGDDYQDSSILKATHYDSGLYYTDSKNKTHKIIKIKNVKSNKGICMISVIDRMITGAESFNQPIDDWNTSNVPEFMALYEIIPYIDYSPLDDETIRVAVKDYLAGGETMNAIIKKYGKIEDWNTSEVTDMSKLPLESHISKRYKNSQVKKFDKKFRHNKTRGRNRKMHR